jgi:hypothetical protein
MYTVLRANNLTERGGGEDLYEYRPARRKQANMANRLNVLNVTCYRVVYELMHYLQRRPTNMNCVQRWQLNDKNIQVCSSKENKFSHSSKNEIYST